MRCSSRLLVLLLSSLVAGTVGQGFKASDQPIVGVSTSFGQQQRQYANGKRWQRTYKLNPKAACSIANSRSLCAAAASDSADFYAELMFATSPAIYSSTDPKYIGSLRLVAAPSSQGDCQTCSAFAVAAAAETAMAAALHVDVVGCSISVQALHFCPPDNQPGRSCLGGYTIDSTLSILEKWSAVLPTQQCLPYKADLKGELLGNNMCSRVCTASSTYASQGSFSSRRITTMWDAQRHIRSHGAVITRFDIMDDFRPFFDNPANAKAVYKPKTGAEFVGGHAVVLVGYDNDKQFWFAKNSWGSNWADGGFFRVAYGTCKVLIGDTAEVYGVRWTPKVIPEAVKLRVTIGPKPDCYLYKATQYDYPSLVAASAGITLDTFLAENTLHIPNLDEALQGKELLLCNPQPERIIVAPAPSQDTGSVDHSSLTDGKTKARAFCNSPEFKKLKCSAASDAEESKSTSVCIYCGTMWSIMPKGPKLPKDISSYGSYWQNVAQTISLACRGRIVVRAVFKITQQQKECTTPAAFLDGGDTKAGETPRVRCELQLPAGSGYEASRAVKAKEAKCWRCDKGKCPSKVGVWYSDSYTKVVPGCDQKFDADYDPPKVGMIFNPGGKALVAKFEVCSDPGCFDPVYEDKKLETAIVAEKRNC